MSTKVTQLSPQLQTLLEHLARRLDQSEDEIVTRALYQYARQQSDSWPKSIGAGWDPQVTGENSEDWLRDNWKPD